MSTSTQTIFERSYSEQISQPKTPPHQHLAAIPYSRFATALKLGLSFILGLIIATAVANG